MKYLQDPSKRWNKTSLSDKMEWLIKSKIHASKLAEYVVMEWLDLPFQVQVAIGTSR